MLYIHGAEGWAIWKTSDAERKDQLIQKKTGKRGKARGKKDRILIGGHF